ncbi:MAG: (2Fe-2S)-binding protein [Caulobacter sp.]|nr:(2Fe-2S)-binding protein [Caulobacter sp.]
MTVKLTVNSQVHDVDAEPDTPLLWVLRDLLGMVGTKYGCGVAQCGACTVHLDGTPVRSCVTSLSRAASRQVTTIEGVGADPVGARVQEAWKAVDVPQCGYCQAGQIMSATALLHAAPRPTDEEIDAAMNGNLCRCATYLRIRKAIKAASGQVEA